MTSEVSPLSGPDNRPAQAELRASHADRDRVVEILRVAAGDGRLTAEELDERLEAALTARTYSELAVLTADLPAAGQPAEAAPARAKDLVKIDVHSGNARRVGPWVVPRRIEVSATSGNVKLDLTKAVITGSDLDIDASVKSGNLIVVTKPGIVVDADDVSVRSGNVRVRPHKELQAPVVLRVHITGKVGSGNITARPPRRTFWQWLTRQPIVYA